MNRILACLLCLVTLSVSGEPLKVVATFSILADFVKQIGREHVVVSIVGPNSDAHIYEPTPQDVKKVHNADTIFTNGLNFEGWLSRLIETSGCKGDIVVATTGITPRFLNDPDEGVVEDPHAWHDVLYVKIYIKNIAEALAKIDPAHRDVYEENAKNYLAALDKLHNHILTEMGSIAQDKRKIITAHDAFGYFGARYAVEFLAPVGISTEAEPSVQDIISLIKTIRKHKIKTIFVENISNPKMIHQIAEETGVEVGGVIYSDALSEPNGLGATYLDLMYHNVGLFMQAMRSADVS